MMQNPYSVHSQKDITEMLNSMGLTHIEQLLQCIPESIRLKNDLDLPPPLDEGQSDRLIRQRASANQTVLSRISYLGGGLYEHIVPAVVDYLSERGEFLTSYTPYQPKMSQGSLEVLWEYQQKMQSLLGVPVVNASSYDGSTALVDAFNMVCYQSDSKSDLLIANTLWPQTKLILKSSFSGKDNDISEVTYNESGRIDLDQLETYFSVKLPLAFGFQCPNAFGVIEDIEAIVRLCQEYNVVSVLYYHPFLSGIFEPPGLLGVDIVCGEGQVLGNHLNAGGPTLGFLGCQYAFVPAIPGRIVGIKRDENDEPFFALVNEEREQHVARDKATSNICSNQANCAMRATFFLSLIGEQGLQDLTLKNAALAYHLCQRLCQINGVQRKFSSPFFNEFVIELPVDIEDFLEEMSNKGIYMGINGAEIALPGCLLIAVTETKDKAQLDFTVRAFEESLKVFKE